MLGEEIKKAKAAGDPDTGETDIGYTCEELL